MQPMALSMRERESDSLSMILLLNLRNDLRGLILPRLSRANFLGNDRSSLVFCIKGLPSAALFLLFAHLVGSRMARVATGFREARLLLHYSELESIDTLNVSQAQMDANTSCQHAKYCPISLRKSYFARAFANLVTALSLQPIKQEVSYAT